MQNPKCHVVGVVLRLAGAGGGRVSTRTVEDRYPKNVAGTSAANAVSRACADLDFLDRNGRGICIPSGYGADVTRFLRNECQGKYAVLKRHL
ncbi:hypothetical protein RYH80_07365 [Halobaculum sp. MBLA0147]|uniref:hypothetical protein n=1 Tax=Halobaculum sp. MBLA0147 TaxID=3079934 RepID=UPI0035242CA9